MAEVSFSRDEGLVVLVDDWSDSDAGGMSSSEEEALDREIEGNNDSSRLYFFRFLACQFRELVFA